RKLERADRTLGKVGYRGNAVVLADSPVERDVDMGGLVHTGDLALENASVRCRLGNVIGHVDAGRDAAGSCGLRGPFDALPAKRRSGMDVPLNNPRTEQGAGTIEYRARCRRSPVADLADFLPAARDIRCRRPALLRNTL